MSLDDPTTTRAVLLNDHNPLSVIDRLPTNVFPVRMKVKLLRQREHDRPDDTFRQPDYPVELRQPTTPYIPESTVYFDNPVERPPEGELTWSRNTFCDKLTDILNHVEGVAGVDEDALILSEFDIVEVPDQYVTTDAETGELGVKPDLYKRKGEMRIARFAKEGTLTATDVREHLDEALPGESRTPVQLVRVEEVTAKPQRLGANTQSTAGRAQYYTETDADNIDQVQFTPAVYELRSRSRPSDRTRPLTPAFSQLESLLPGLMNGASDLLNILTFVGEKQEKTVFHAEEVRQ